MKRSIGILLLFTSLILGGCGSSNDFQQVSGQQGNVGNPNPTPTPTTTPTPGPTGTITGQVLDAVTGLPLSGVVVSVPAANVNAQGGLSATTDANGNYTIFNAPVGTYTIRFRSDQFVEFSREVTVVENQETVVATVTLSPGLTQDERFRFVLTWGEEPPDYESHLWLPAANPFHIFFPSQNRGDSQNFPFATLDVDDTTSFGPETVTINQVLSGGVYEYGVHNFSNTGTVEGAVVQIMTKAV